MNHDLGKTNYMADEIRINKPTVSGAGESSHSSSSRGGSKTPWIILALVVVVLAVLGFVFRDKLMGKTATPVSKVSGYQAVFLTNGQVYFGKLGHTEGQYLTLKDIYYLQVTTPPGLQGSQQNTTAAQQQAQSQLSLVKLGNELHGPVDSMQINRDQVLFFEDMKDDGKVMQAIHQYQTNPPAAAGQAPATQAPATNTPVAPATQQQQTPVK